MARRFKKSWKSRSSQNAAFWRGVRAGKRMVRAGRRRRW